MSFRTHTVRGTLPGGGSVHAGRNSELRCVLLIGLSFTMPQPSSGGPGPITSCPAHHFTR